MDKPRMASVTVRSGIGLAVGVFMSWLGPILSGDAQTNVFDVLQHVLVALGAGGAVIGARGAIGKLIVLIQELLVVANELRTTQAPINLSQGDATASQGNAEK